MRKNILIILTIITIFSMTGCGLRRKKDTATETDANAIEVYDSMEDLKEDHYYILHDNKYYPVYIKNASYEVPETDQMKHSSHNDKRSLFFNEDWEKIPTFYQGDMLIYYTSENLNEEFGFERYEDVGYSLGICNLKRMDSGRYAVNAEKDESNNQTYYIDPDSDANRLYEMKQSQIIIDNIGGAQLRSGNISRGGVIIGLKKNKYYSTDVYGGSKLKNYILKADTRVLTSMEDYKTTDYSFLRSKILKINIPDFFNNGYYNINGHGIFRYVNGVTYTSKTDFNIPNEVPEEEKEEAELDEMGLQDSKNVIKEDFTINEETDVEVIFEFGKSEGNYELADPIVKVISSECAYTLSEDDENVQKLDAHLKAGQYYLEISGLNGRTYEYKIIKK